MVSGYKYIPVELKSTSHKELLYKNGGFINLYYYNTLQNNYCKLLFQIQWFNKGAPY